MEGKVNIMFSDQALSCLDDNNIRDVFSHIICVAQEGTGLFVADDEPGFGALISSGVIMRVREIIPFGVSPVNVFKTYILNPDHIWKGESWMRNVVLFDSGTVASSRPWLPMVDFLKNNRCYKL